MPSVLIPLGRTRSRAGTVSTTSIECEAVSENPIRAVCLFKTGRVEPSPYSGAMIFA